MKHDNENLRFPTRIWFTILHIIRRLILPLIEIIKKSTFGDPFVIGIIFGFAFLLAVCGILIKIFPITIPYAVPVEYQAVYTIQPGDSLYSIAQAYEVDLDQLMAMNGITNPNNITPGRQLYIPLQPTTRANSYPLPVPFATSGMFEVEIPPKMQQGTNSIIRVTMRYSFLNQLTPTIEVKGDTIFISTPIPYSTPGPIAEAYGLQYQLYMVARLDATGFDMQPTSEQDYFISEGRDVTWSWVVSPKSAGPQVMTLTVIARWKPISSDNGQVIQYQLFRKNLYTNVEVPVLTRNQPVEISTPLSVGIGLVIGSIITLLLSSLINYLRKLCKSKINAVPHKSKKNIKEEYDI